MSNLYARAVFFTDDAEESLRFYTERLGFNVDWKFDEEGRTFVFQVSLLGFEVIVNQTHDETIGRAGHGRVFIGLDDDQAGPVRKHFVGHGVKGERVDWGRPTLVVRDIDRNELFFWFPNDDLGD
jgi:catechol 2,3-dioxygenase-like lactoylglutathione lyase family enzyme